MPSIEKVTAAVLGGEGCNKSCKYYLVDDMKKYPSIGFVSSAENGNNMEESDSITRAFGLH